MRRLYTFFIRLYWFVALLLYPFKTKVKKWIFGRIRWREKLPRKSKVKLVWLHCSSLGEFEMARPIVEKMEWMDTELFISFFSPSGYEVRKDYELADHVFYLPVDTPENAKDLINRLKPDVILYVKYDLWPNLIKEAKKNSIPQLLFSATFRKDQLYFKPWGGLFRNTLKNLDGIFVQDQASKELLQSIGVKSEVTGDVRFDRALEVKQHSFSDPFLDFFCSEAETIIVFGSTYPIEHHWIHQLADQLTSSEVSFKFIVAPHQIDPGSMHDIKDVFPNAYYYTKHKERASFESNILVLDTMGMLTFVYRYAKLAYVGGGFGKSLHNALEAAVYGIPVIVGPNHLKFPEVDDFIQQGGFVQVNNKTEFQHSVKELLPPTTKVEKLGKSNEQLVNARSGAAKKIELVIRDFLISN